MSTKEQVSEHMRFIDKLPQRVVGFMLTGDNELEKIIVFINPNENDVNLYSFEKNNVYINADKAGTKPIGTVRGSYTIPEEALW